MLFSCDLRTMVSVETQQLAADPPLTDRDYPAALPSSSPAVPVVSSWPAP